jgi:hypothetical protein
MLALRKIKISKIRILSAIVSALVLIIACCEVVGWPFLRLPLERFMQN